MERMNEVYGTSRSRLNSSKRRCNEQPSRISNRRATDNTMEGFLEEYPPYNPSLSHFHSRLSTFHSWPGHTLATPTKLAEAGFFYLNDRDRTECFHCNGGLQLWKRDDDPWYEHAKWFPSCKFLRWMKGPDYVSSVANRYPNLQRPNIFVPLCNTVPATCSSTRDVSADTAASSLESLKSIDERTEEAMESIVVTDAATITCNVELIKLLVKRKLEKENKEYASVMKLVEDVQDEEASTSSFTSSSTHTDAFSSSSQTQLSPALVPLPTSQMMSLDQVIACNVSATHGPDNSNDVEMTSSLQVAPTALSSHREHRDLSDAAAISGRSLPFGSEFDKEAYQKLIDEQTCKVCLDRKINCLFLPCRHLCCCIDCGPALRSCPLCRTKLEKLLKIYRIR